MTRKLLHTVTAIVNNEKGNLIHTPRRFCLVLSQKVKLLRMKVVSLIQQLTSFRPADVHLRLGSTTISMRIINSPLSPPRSRDFAIATAQYIVHGLRTGSLPRFLVDGKPTTGSNNPLASNISPVKVAGHR